jgi:paraquat-inducible protein B
MRTLPARFVEETIEQPVASRILQRRESQQRVKRETPIASDDTTGRRSAKAPARRPGRCCINWSPRVCADSCVLTGQRYVALDFFPHAPAVSIDTRGMRVELPTVPNTVEEDNAANATLQQNSPMHTDIREALTELRRTVAALKALSDYLEQHPGSVVWGKSADH